MKLIGDKQSGETKREKKREQIRMSLFMFSDLDLFEAKLKGEALSV